MLKIRVLVQIWQSLFSKESVNCVCILKFALTDMLLIHYQIISTCFERSGLEQSFMPSAS